MLKNSTELSEGFLNHLKRVIAIPSLLKEGGEGACPFGKGIQKALEEFLKISSELGMKTFLDPEGYYGYAEVGEGEKLFGVLGHIDVVPPGDLSKWNSDPFSLEIREGNIYGRGVTDDKGPLLLTMHALKNMLDQGHSHNYRIRFIFGTDEENLWRGIEKYLEKEETPLMGITPDSTFPIVYAEKGLLQCKLVAPNKSGLLFKGGDAFNCVPSSFKTELNDTLESKLKELSYEYTKDENGIEIVGKSVHAKIPEEGINAVIRYLHALNESGTKTNSGDFVCDNLIHHKFAEPIFGELKDDVSGELKFNLGKIEFTEEHEILFIDMRYPVTSDKETIISLLKETCQRYNFSYEEYDHLRSIYLSVDSPIVKGAMNAYQKITNDFDSKPISSGGATYARAIDNCVAFGPSLPGALKTEHQPNECITVENMTQALRIYESFFSNLEI